MNEKCIIWDWNGTLLNDVGAAVNALNRMLALRNVPPTTLEFYRKWFGFPVRPFYEKLGLDLEHEDWDKICFDFHRFIGEEPDQHLRHDTIEALELVKNSGTHQVILSALRHDLLVRDTAHEGVAGFFDLICGVDNLDGASKLSRGIETVEILKGKGLKVTTFIGDTLHDAEVAAALGCKAVLVEGGHQASSRLHAAGCPVMPSLVAAAEYAIMQP